MLKLTDSSFNPEPPTCMHLDINSCFATIEQQANPFLRGRPVAVAPHTGPSGCIIAASKEAKRYGIKTGMRVKEGLKLYPKLYLLPPDPDKYRVVHLAFRRLLRTYTPTVIPKSIDEFTLWFEPYQSPYLIGIAQDIKQKIKQAIGEWLTVSIGIGPNRFLAKTASNLKKPDGLEVISKANVEKIYALLQLTDLTGIKRRNSLRLASAGIYSVADFYRASPQQLKAAFKSVVWYHWYTKLRGFELVETEREQQTIGHSYVLPKTEAASNRLIPIIMKLTQKMATRLRSHGYTCHGIHLSIYFRDGIYWHKGAKTASQLFATQDIYRHLMNLYELCPHRSPAKIIAVTCFNLNTTKTLQLDLMGETVKKEALSQAMDGINARWGDYVVTSARMMGTKDAAPDRIAFGGVRELQEIQSTW